MVENGAGQGGILRTTTPFAGARHGRSAAVHVDRRRPHGREFTAGNVTAGNRPNREHTAGDTR